MSACSPEMYKTVDLNLHTSCKSDGNKTVKTKRKSLNFSFLSKSGSRKWRSNNLQLARENARLKKDIQKWVQLLTENSIKCNSLEVSWRRRGETLSKIDILCHMIGKQLQKVVESLTEIRSACQVELSIPVGGEATENAERISRCRHSMPNVKLERLSKLHNVSRLSSKSQLVNHVNPMVSGHPIVKPTITLQRLNLQDVQSNSQMEQIHSPVPELHEEQIEEIDLTTIVEKSMDTSPPPSDNSDDEEEVAELPVRPSTGRMSACSSAPSYRNIILPVAEVPLERLSLARITDRCKTVAERNMLSGLILQDDKPVSISNGVSATSSHINVPSLPEQDRVMEICSNTSPEDTRPVSAIYSVSKDTTAMINVTPVLQHVSKLTGQQSTECTSRTLDVTSSVIDSATPASNQRSNNSSVRKYPPSSRTKTPASSELRNSQMNGVSEKFRLVVALKDVSSYLHNGTLANIEQLEETKVKTGSSAHAESKHNSESGHEDLELSILDTSVESHTELNFTAGIGTMNYTALPLNNCNMEGSCLSPKAEFLNRIKNEDPLEGPSWRFESDGTPTGRRKVRSRSFHSHHSIKKENAGSLDTSKHQPIENHHSASQGEKEATESVHDEDMEFTECMHLCDVTRNKPMADESHMGKEASSDLVRTSDVCKTLKTDILEPCSTEEVVISPHRKRPRINYNKDVSDDSELEEEWKPAKKLSKKKRSRSKAQSTEMNCKSLSRNVKMPRSNTVAEESSVNRKQSVIHRDPLSMPQSRRTSPKLEYIEAGIGKENSGNTDEEHVRTKRRAAPTSLKEVSLKGKMRRDTH